MRNVSKLTRLLFCLLATIVIVSCGKEDNSKENSSNNGSSSSVYYVKYEAEHFRGDTWYYRLIEYVTPEGVMQAFSYDGDVFTAYAGPFHKGDTAQITMTPHNGDVHWLAISVKENDSPFVTKVSTVDSLTLVYIF